MENVSSGAVEPGMERTPYRNIEDRDGGSPL